MEKGKKYAYNECYSIVKIITISIGSEENDKIQFCPFCSDYLEEASSSMTIRREPLLNTFEEYDSSDDYYYDDDLDEE